MEAAEGRKEVVAAQEGEDEEAPMGWEGALGALGLAAGWG